MQLDASREKPAKREMKATVQQAHIVVLCLAVSSSVPILWLTNAWPSTTHDGLIHMRRIRALADALRAGVLYPRWFPDYSFGYGYPVLNYQRWKTRTGSELDTLHYVPGNAVPGNVSAGCWPLLS